MKTLLLTRPLPQSEAFAAALEAALPGRFRPVIAPLLAIEARGGVPDTSGCAAIAFTSANGVAAFARRSPDRALPAFCVGESTAEAAREAGFRAEAAGGDLASLAALLVRAAPPGPVLHARGALAAGDLAALLAPRGIAVRPAILYAQTALPPSPEADDLGRTGRLDVLAAFSPRSARLLAEAAAPWDLARSTALGISAAALAPLAPLRLARRLTAPAPSRAAMLDALAALA